MKEEEKRSEKRFLTQSEEVNKVKEETSDRKQKAQHCMLEGAVPNPQSRSYSIVWLCA